MASDIAPVGPLDRVRFLVGALGATVYSSSAWLADYCKQGSDLTLEKNV